MAPSHRTPPESLGRIAAFFSELVDELSKDDETASRPARARVRAATVSRYPLVQQDDETGCGVACIAMLAGEDYEKVKGSSFPRSESASSIRRTATFAEASSSST